ncbi:MAG: hypothetical protein ACK4YQ_16855 [Phenylobacterium sp.]|uniref:hypothetical protein n=1 Tax=Phenylobacterium sp. TaxID=1871053 RepID=UPI00391DA4AF
MSDAKHSPAPFRLDTTVCGHVIVDALGDSIAGLALRTGDHPAEEQLANALLFAAAPALLAAARLGRAAIAQDRLLTIESATVPRPGTLEPDLSTLDEDAAAIVAELDLQLAQIDAAIAAAGALS